jgi:hypothetical protein
MDEERNVAQISRRQLLKRAGVGAAAVWAAPFLTSTAAASVDRKVKCAPGQKCPSLCGVDACPGGNCFCYPTKSKDGTTGKGCACACNISCSASPACTKNKDCPAGWTCTINCCQAFPGKSCVPNCGSGDPNCLAAGASGGGRTTNG